MLFAETSLSVHLGAPHQHHSPLPLFFFFYSRTLTCTFFSLHLQQTEITRDVILMEFFFSGKGCSLFPFLVAQQQQESGQTLP